VDDPRARGKTQQKVSGIPGLLHVKVDDKEGGCWLDISAPGVLTLLYVPVPLYPPHIIQIRLAGEGGQRGEGSHKVRYGKVW
jgi:hypothetical protein